MAQQAPKRDRLTVSVYTDVEVEVSDVLSEAGDDQIKAEYELRFGSGVCLPSTDLVAEIRAELLGGRVNAALALCEGHIVAQIIPEARRQSQYQSAGRAH